MRIHEHFDQHDHNGNRDGDDEAHQRSQEAMGDESIDRGRTTGNQLCGDEVALERRPDFLNRRICCWDRSIGASLHRLHGEKGPPYAFRSSYENIRAPR
jgi:hypothetical protein